MITKPTPPPSDAERLAKTMARHTGPFDDLDCTMRAVTLLPFATAFLAMREAASTGVAEIETRLSHTPEHEPDWELTAVRDVLRAALAAAEKVMEGK